LDGQKNYSGPQARDAPPPLSSVRSTWDNRPSMTLEKHRLDQCCAEFDRLVYQLYELTDDEIAIVEGQSK
jgi:hypothetical protein